MVTISLEELLEMKQQFDEEYPGGVETMPSRDAISYRNLLADIRKTAKRNQLTLPGVDLLPPAPEGQLRLL